MTKSDMLFFYHAVSAPSIIARLLKVARQERPLRVALIRVLERAADNVRRYAGTLFACTAITGSPAYERDEDSQFHFRGRIFAPFDTVHVFQQPLKAAAFADAVKISRQSALTPLGGEEFARVKQLLAAQNSLPPYLAAAEPGGASFRMVSRDTWRAIACATSVRFIDETQVRVFLINYLLDELRDPATPVLQECQCFRGEQRTGIADYFVTLCGQWVPVEAKLNLCTERDLAGQVAKYTHISSFVATKGQRRGERCDVANSGVCIVIDQHGIVVLRDGVFVAGSPDKPAIARTDLQAMSANQLRERLKAFL